jgi:hypothetical protein
MSASLLRHSCDEGNFPQVGCVAANGFNGSFETHSCKEPLLS